MATVGASVSPLEISEIVNRTKEHSSKIDELINRNKEEFSKEIPKIDELRLKHKTWESYVNRIKFIKNSEEVQQYLFHKEKLS